MIANLNQTRFRIWMRKRLLSNQQGSKDQPNAQPFFFLSSLKTLGLSIIKEFWQSFDEA